jgi:ubiquinone/menaquinone biosynthesis C-methylase UbiE
MNRLLPTIRSARILPLLFVALLVPIAGAQEKSVAPDINKPYENPDVKGFVNYFEGESREVFTHRKEIVAACPLKPGMTVADIGAGTGLFTRPMAAAVGPQGKVYAVDIAPKFVEHIKETCRQAGLTNVECVVCTQTSVELPAGSIDLAFLSDVYHHFEFPQKSLASIHRALRKGGQLVVVDYRRVPGKTAEWILKHVRAGQEVVTKEIEAAGFRRVGEEFPFLKENYGIRFEKVESPAGSPPSGSNAYAKWPRGPGHQPDFFPIAVWLQSPRNAAKYRAIGVNVYVGLWEGPTADQIAELRRQEMPVVCEQNQYALEHLDERTIVGWMHGDEPDNAQSLGQGKGYGPPIPPQKIIEDYRRIKAKDPRRPVMLNLGQGVAWDGWYGRGVRTNHPEDYAQYVRGGDIVSFDIYPAVADRPAVAGKLWYVPRGVQRLRGWAGPERIVWDCIECTRIGNLKVKPTPEQVKAEVWMSLIHGSQGLIYFCHQFQPRFIEAGLLADEEMARAVAAINRQVQSLAAVLNSPSLPAAARVTVDPAEVSADMTQLLGPAGIALAVKKHEGATCLFAVRMEAKRAKATFRIQGMSGAATVRVLGEDRTLRVQDGEFQDDFGPWAVHLYKVE